MIDPNVGDQGSLVGVIGSGSPGLGPNLFDDPEGVAIHGTAIIFLILTTIGSCVTAWWIN